MSTVLAGPNCARYLADFGADVIKVERPGGDGLRDMAWKDPRDGIGLWWKLVNRNKRTIVIDVKDRQAGTSSSGSSTTPTCSSRTHDRARWNESGWARTHCSNADPRW